MSIDNPDELAALRAAGRVVAETIREMARRVRPGVTTAELDDVAAQIFTRHGARSGPQLDYDFPGVTCISRRRRVRARHPGHAPPARGPTRQARRHRRARRLLRRRLPHGRRRPRPRPREQRLMAAAQSALQARPRAGHGRQQRRRDRRRRPDARSSAAASASAPSSPATASAAASTRSRTCPNIAWDGPELTNGLVITVEPIIAAGRGDVYVDDDGWTIRTEDGSPLGALRAHDRRHRRRADPAHGIASRAGPARSHCPGAAM